MEFLNQITDLIDGLDEQTIWVIKIFAVVFATVVANFIAGRVIAHIARGSEKSQNLWDDALVHSLRRPVRLLIWIVGLTFAAEVAYGNKDAQIFSIIHPARDVGVIFSVTWFALRFIKYVELNIFTVSKYKKSSLDRTTVGAVAKLLRITVFITAILVAMQSLGFSVTGIMAAGGVGGLAVGFAAKDLLANFFGAIMIYFDRPFKVGEWIRSPDKEIEGTVEEIGWRQTRIRTFDKRPLYVPNSVFSTVAVENPSRMTHRRIHETIGVRYDDMDQVKKIVADVEKMLKSHKDIDNTQTLIVNLNSFSASSVDFFIYTFTKTTDWIEYHGVKQDVLLKIADIIKKNKAEIAFPTSTIHVPEGVKLSPESAGLVKKAKK